MDVVCEVCGDVGYKYLLVQCKGCQSANRHRYCMDTIIYGGSSIEWFCDDCPPKHNDIVESLKERRDDHHSIQLGSSMIDEPNVKRVEVTKELWPWGRRRRRSHMTRRYCTWGRRKPRSHKERRDNIDACAKCGDTFSSSEMFFEEKSKCNVFKERESENDLLINQLENADSSSHSASDFAAEIQKKPTMNTIEFLDLSTEKDCCSFSLNYVEGSIHQGTKADFLPLINDVERSHPFVTDDSCPILPNAEQEDSSSHALGSAEQPQPLEMVDRDGNPDGSSHSPLDPALKIEEHGIEAGLFASVNFVEQYCPGFTDQASPTLSSEDQVRCLSPMSESWEQPHPLEVVKPYDDVPESILESEPASAHSQRMQVSDPHVGNMDALDPSKECLDSRSMSKIVELPSSSDGDGNSAVEKDKAERTVILSGMETVSPALDNTQASRPSVDPSSFSNGGDSPVKEHSERTECLTEPVAPALDSVQGSNPSTTKGCLVSNVDNSNEENTSDNHLLCTIVNKELGQLNALSYPNISSVDFQFSHNDLNESPHPTKHQKTKLIMKDGNAHPAHLKSSPSKQLDQTCLSASSELSSKAKEVNDGNDAEQRCSSSVPTSENIVPKKRKRHVESAAMNQRRSAENYDEALCPGKSTNQHVNDHTQAKQRKGKNAHLENSSVPCTQNDGNDAEQRCSSSVPTSENIVPKKRKQHVESAAMNQRRSAENYDEALCLGKSTNQHVNDHTQAKKQRRANKDKNAHLENSSVRCTQNDAAQSASEAVVADGHSSLSRMPAVSAPTDQQHFICTQPIDRPYWTGIMKIGQEYISLAAHLSNQACQKVQELSRSLPPVMKVTKHSKLKAWPKRWEASEPTDESIGLFFFPDDMRPNKDLDRLVQHVTDHGIVLKYVFGSAKLLIFPSVFLPEQSQMFQGKHYLWGVFKRRMGSKAGNQLKQKVRAPHTVERKRGAAR